MPLDTMKGAEPADKKAYKVSQAVLEILLDCQRVGIDLTVGKVCGTVYIIGLPANKLTADLKERIKRHRQELIDVLNENIGERRLLIPK